MRRRKALLLILFFPDHLSDPNNKHSVFCAVLADCAVFFTVGRDGACADAVHRAFRNGTVIFVKPHLAGVWIGDIEHKLRLTDASAAAQLANAADSMKYALIVISTVPMLILYPFVQKFFDKGVMMGSLKG